MNVELARQTNRWLNLARAQLKPQEGPALEQESRGLAALLLLERAFHCFLQELIQAYALELSSDTLLEQLKAKGPIASCPQASHLQELYQEAEWPFALLQTWSSVAGNQYRFNTSSAKQAAVPQNLLQTVDSQAALLNSNKSIQYAFGQLFDFIEQYRAIAQEY